MTLGLKYDQEDVNSDDPIEQGFIYFDAIQSYTKTIRGQVTKHSIAGGKTITDNFTRDNPTFGFTGVISIADLSNNTLIRDESDNLPDNFNDYPQATQVVESTSKLLNYLPTSISQFIPDTSPTITMASLRDDYKEFVTQVLERLMSGEKQDVSTGKVKTYIRPVKLYEFMGADLVKVIPDLVLTSVSIREDVDTGDALIVDLEFEQVKFVSLRTTAISKDVINALKTKSAAKSKKGNVNSTPKTADDVSDQLANIASTAPRDTTYIRGNPQ